ncbi:DUF4136 domain-containing protein [Croceibacterium sp. TMG7-5b_MA50]|uniref:DUF4136 domain-containing protein n=1 Tax=Croceibacterium sp. TMG7-5b_MA50 TaxID=3121290 RepID=UPI003221CFEB
MTLRTLPAAFAAAAALLATGCTTPAYVSPVEVTRFTGNAPAQLGRGSIAVVAAPGDTGADSLEFSLYQQAVAAELSRLGYNVVRAGTPGGQVAEIALERGVNPALGGGGARSPVSVGVGGSTGGWGGGGVGLGVGINLGGGGRSNVDELYRQLRVQIRPATGATPLWEGRANFTASANSDYAGEQAAAGRLAQALFAGFPGESGATTEVR